MERRHDGDPGAHIVIEGRDLAVTTATAVLLIQQGFRVSLCGGPQAPPLGCPAFVGTPCKLHHVADVVYFDLDLDDQRQRAWLERTRARHPATAIVVEASSDVARRHALLLRGCEVALPASPPQLAAVIIRALRGAHAAV